MVAEEKINIGDMQEGIDLCLGCRACETVCPTNVRYGDILMSAVEVLKEHKKENVVEKVARTAAFKYVLKNKNILRLINKGMYLYQVSGVKYATKKFKQLKPLVKLDKKTKDMPIA